MVKKLFKHEMASYLRTLLPVNIILLVVALMTRVVFFFESDNVFYIIISKTTITLFIVGVAACIFITFIAAIVRFYKNLFTAEGYLSFTLPVTAEQHIWVKLGTALIFQAIAVINVILSLIIVASGDVLADIFKAIDLIFELASKEFTVHIVFYIVEVLALLVVAGAYMCLLWYTCISLGQRSRKNRVFMAIVWYFIYYMITQAFGTVVLVIMTVLEATGGMKAIVSWIEAHTFASIHVGLVGYTVFITAISLIFFVISKKTIENKLNLE